MLDLVTREHYEERRKYVYDKLKSHRHHCDSCDWENWHQFYTVFGENYEDYLENYWQWLVGEVSYGRKHGWTEEEWFDNLLWTDEENEEHKRDGYVYLEGYYSGFGDL